MVIGPPLPLQTARALPADDQIAGGFVPAEAGAVPEDARSGERRLAGDAASEENLQAVAGPFGGTSERVGGTKNDAALVSQTQRADDLLRRASEAQPVISSAA